MCAGLGWISDTKLQLVYTFAGLIYLLLTKVSVSRQRTGVFRYILAHFMSTVLHQKIGKKGLVSTCTTLLTYSSLHTFK